MKIKTLNLKTIKKKYSKSTLNKYLYKVPIEINLSKNELKMKNLLRFLDIFFSIKEKNH